MEKIKLRKLFFKATGKVATDNIALYADWLEERVIKLQSK